MAKKGATEGERAAAEKKSKGPKMFGEGSAYGKKKCPECSGKGCSHCNNTGYHKSIKEDMSGMSQKSGDKRSTESGAGMTAQGVAKYNRRTGGNLKTAVTTPPSKLSQVLRRKRTEGSHSVLVLKVGLVKEERLHVVVGTVVLNQNMVR